MTVILATLIVAPARAEQDAPWPTVRRDGQRSGFTDEVVRGPYERKWFRDFHDEVIATRVEAILGGGRVYVPTLAGRVYALDPATGKTAWTFEARGAVGAAVLYHEGRVIVGDDAGYVTGLDANTGKVAWQYEAGAGVWAAPAGGGGSRDRSEERGARMDAPDGWDDPGAGVSHGRRADCGRVRGHACLLPHR